MAPSSTHHSLILPNTPIGPANKILFDYLFYHENDIKNSLELAALATQSSKYDDWWWKQQLGKCYYRLGLYRDAEKQFQSALKQQQTVDNYLYLAKVFVKLDQPLAALELFEKGMEAFPGEVTIIIGSARVHEGLGDVDSSVKFYKKVFQYDASSVEALLVSAPTISTQTCPRSPSDHLGGFSRWAYVTQNCITTSGCVVSSHSSMTWL